MNDTGLSRIQTMITAIHRHVSGKRLNLLAFSLIYTCLFTAYRTSAQNIDLAWVKQGGSAGDEIARSIITDAAGNSYVCGPFSGTGDFDPGPAVFNLTSNGSYDAFVAKYSPDGNFIWAKGMGGASYDQANCLSLDAAGNIYISGFYSATADFDPGPGVFNLNSAGQWDVFVVKMDAAGNLVWAKSMGGDDYDQPYSLTVDGAGNVYTTGEFFSSVADFDPGAPVFNLPSFGSVDVFISKLDAAGNFVWAKHVGGNSIDRSNSIALGPGGDILVTGYFYSLTTDFDPGTGVFSLSPAGASDIFILKLNTAGDFVWAKKMGGTADDHGNVVATDNAGNVYTSGWYLATGDYDPGPGIYTLPLAGSSGIFVSKLDAAGNFIWARQFSGTAVNSRINSGNTLSINANQDVYITGAFVDEVDFDPGAGTHAFTALGEWDVFVCVLDNAGNYVTAKQMGGPGNDNATGATLDAGGIFYVTGLFSSSADFDPCPGIHTLVSGGAYDFFVAKFATPMVTIAASSISICSGTPVTFTATVTNPGLSPALQWKINGINVGTGSSFTTTTLSNNDQVTCVLITNPACVPPVTDTSNTITITVEPAVTPSVTITTATTTVCTGSTVIFTAVPVNPGIAPVYQWQVNGINVGTNATTFSSSTLANNDVIRVLLTNSSACAAPNTVTSNSLTMQVGAGNAPSISISALTNTVCPGVPVSFSANALNAGPSISYQWKRNAANTGSNSSTYTLSDPVNGDQVYCIMTTTSGCSSETVFYSDTITVQVNPVPVITITPPNPTIAAGASVQLNASITGAYSSILWTPGTGLNNTGILNPVASPPTTTTYKLSVVSANQCNAEASLTVKVTRDIYIPNSFTPNSDGLNDLFRIPPGTSFTLQQFHVYNTYGNLVFSTSDIGRGWDGSFKGSFCPNGTYTYIIKGYDAKGEILLKGTVLLIR